MADPIRWNSKILLAKVETTYGTDASPTAAANAILATDVQLSPMEGKDVPRDLETPFLSASEKIPAEMFRRLTFKVELQGSGVAGDAPLYGPLLRALGVAETITASTSVAYNPISDSHEAVSMYLWVGSTLFEFLGTRGNADVMLGAGGIPYVQFTMDGLYSAASETTRDETGLVAGLSAFKKPKIASHTNTPTFTIGGTPMVLRDYSLALNNQVEPRFLIGRENIIITDRAEELKATVEAVPLTTLDPMALAESQTEVAVQIVHGKTAGGIVTINIPKATFNRLSGLSETQGITEWPLSLTPLPTNGDDQWTITFT